MYCFFFEEPNKNGITYISPTMYGGFLPHPYEDIEYPDIYLNFCKEDIKQDDKRAITNALSNCKRAIHLRIDLLLNQYGLLCKNENCDFPQKLDLINSVGLLPTLILKGINDERNLLEHRYKIPDKVRVCEAIDAAELLYLATGKILSNTPIEAIIGFDVEPIHRVMRINPNTGELLFFELKVNNKDIIKLNKECNVNFVGTRLRDFNWELRPCFEIGEKPLNTIELSYQNKENWELIIKTLARDAYNNGFENAGQISERCISTIISIPLDPEVLYYIHDYIDKRMADRFASNEDKEASEA